MRLKALVSAFVIASLVCVMHGAGLAAGPETSAIRDRHVGVSRSKAAHLPRAEGDQAVVEGWPLYRTERGQSAFNEAMATLKASDGAAPSAARFKSCPDLECDVRPPDVDKDGWLPAGRLWVSPSSYILFVKSPRPSKGREARRRPRASMRYFIFHEFHNGSRNTDAFDTISSHSGAIFVPFYMTKTAKDAHGRQFVAIVQVAPYDVVSIHAGNKGSAGPGVEVAKNVTDQLEPLQASAGIVLALAAKGAAPQLEVVNHRGTEGLPMLEAYRRRSAALKDKAAVVQLPFTAASPEKIASASASLGELIRRTGVSPPIPVAARGIVTKLVRATGEGMGNGDGSQVMRLTGSAPQLVEPVMPAAEPSCVAVPAFSLLASCDAPSKSRN